MNKFAFDYVRIKLDFFIFRSKIYQRFLVCIVGKEEGGGIKYEHTTQKKIHVEDQLSNIEFLLLIHNKQYFPI